MANNNKNKKTIKAHLILLVLAFIAFFTYLAFEIINIKDLTQSINDLLEPLFVFSLLICFTVIAVKYKKNTENMISVGSILIIAYCIINILLLTKVIKLPKDEYVPNFYNQSILEVNKWKTENNITVNEKYEYSDTVKKDYVISQDVFAPTLSKEIKEITITISQGPDLLKEVVVPNFIGLKYEEVLKYIEENHLSNVKIVYQKSEKDLDTVISQSISGTIKRNDEIIITFAKETDELGDVEIIDFTNETKLYAISWLEKYGFKVETIEDYSDTIDEGYVIDQSVKNEIKSPLEEIITLTISKGKKILAPDISSMTVSEINKWAIENEVKISYIEEYSDEIKLGDVISSSVNQGELIDKDQKVKIAISKGKLEMINVTSVNEFTNWAENNNISYNINYLNSDTVKKDNIITCSHKPGDVIKKDDTVILTVSRGKEISIPNFVGMNKSDIQSKCTTINLSCSFKYGGYTENTKKDIAINQSKKSGTKVSEGTSLTITLSSGIQEKVTVPSFVGKTKSSITSSCNNIGIKCSFKYASGYNSTPKDTCISQSTTGKVNKGSTVTITLSNGPAKTYSIVIQADWLTQGNPQATKKTLESKLSTNCQGVTFKYSFQTVNSGIGYLNQNSQVKVGLNNFTQGKTYNVIINSN